MLPDPSETTQQLTQGVEALNNAHKSKPGDPVSGCKDLLKRTVFIGHGLLYRRLIEIFQDSGKGMLEEMKIGFIESEKGVAEPEEFRGVGLVVCIYDDVSLAVVHETARACSVAGTACLTILPSGDGVSIGPMLIPSGGPCIACAHGASPDGPKKSFDDLLARSAVRRIPPLAASEGDRYMLEGAGNVLREQVSRRFSAGPAPQSLAASLHVARNGSITQRPVLRQQSCPLCYASEDASEPKESTEPTGRDEELRILAETFLALAHDQAPRRSVTEDPDLCRSVGIIGGGTAGFLTALALMRARPELEVTLIESSSVPVIGVGEATTPLMPIFLHQKLGLDIAEFFSKVQPTLKLGIRFEWGQPGDYYFNYPFGPAYVLEPYTYSGQILDHSLYCMLMSAGKLPILDTGSSSHTAAFSNSSAAYHLDNRRLVAYLAKKAKERGVRHIDTKIVDAMLSPDGRQVESLMDDQGQTFKYDLYIDCTGFRSLLLGKAMATPFKSYDNSLPTDTAIVADVPHGGNLNPYTRAETMDHGWCWSVPQLESNHRGYVFSSAFSSVDEAAQEMRRKNPGIGDLKTLRFRCGRHEGFWQGNVVAIGNSYGFVDPLESTALHMVIRQIGFLIDSLPLRRRDMSAVAALLNRKVDSNWDYLSWFLALHYKFNRKLETPFWQMCANETDISRHGELLEYFKARGPLSYGGPNVPFEYSDPLWQAEGIDTILLGQKVDAELSRPVIGEATWNQRLQHRRVLISNAVAQDKALEAMNEDPQLLRLFERSI